MDAKWLNDQFDKNPAKSKGELSAILGVQPSGISKMLSGTRQIKAKEYLLMRKFFDMPGNGDAAVRKSGNIQSYANLRAEDPSNQNWTGGRGRSDYNIIEVSDSAMVPDFLPGERVLIDTSSKPDAGSGIFAIDEQGRILIRIAEQRSPTKIQLSTIAKTAEARTVASGKLKILGRVIAKLNWL